MPTDISTVVSSIDAFTTAKNAPAKTEQAAAQGAANTKASAASADRAAPQEQAAAPPKEDLHTAVQQIQKFLADTQRTIEFQIDDSTGTSVVFVRDKANGDLIRQIPSEETLRLARILREYGDTHSALLSLTA